MSLFQRLRQSFTAIFTVPFSLRQALLFRSLIVLAVLLLLIGMFQYVVMKDFMYRNKAEALEAQIISLPRSFITDWRGRAHKPKEAPTINGLPPILLPTGTSLALIDADLLIFSFRWSIQAADNIH